MSSESCLAVVVEEENVIETVSVVGLVLSGIFGVIIGAVIGFIIFKCFLGKNQCCGPTTAIGTEKRNEDNKVSKVSLTYENVINEGLPSSEIRLTKKTSDSDDEDDDQQRRFFVLNDFITDMTWDKMILELGKHELIEMLRLEITMWEERHICLLQLYRCISNQFFSNGKITENQHHDFLSVEEKILSAALEKMKEEWEVYIRSLMHFDGQSLIDGFTPFQEIYTSTIKTMITTYRDSARRFSATISQAGDVDKARDEVENLLVQIDAIEGFYRENHDEIIESIHSIFQKFGSILRELVVILISESEMNRLLTATCDTSLEKLVKTGRISSETKESVKDVIPDDINITRDELNDVFSQMHPNILAHYHSLLKTREQESENALRSVLVGYESQIAADGFVHSYLSACSEQKLQRMALLRDFAESEQSGITSKLKRLSQIQDQKRFELIRIFCQQLENNDALSRMELQQMRQDFARKLDATRGKVFTTCQRNISELWRLYEQHCSRQQEEGNRVDACILQDSVSDNLISLEGFLQLQMDLSSDDQHIIMQERDSLFLLLINQVNAFRAKWSLVVENDLAKCQAFLLVKKSTDLVNDTIAEILGIIERLWNERNSMKEYVRETASLSSMKSILGISDDEMCKIVSDRLVKNLIGKKLPQLGENTALEITNKTLVNEISAQNTFSNFATVSKDHNERLSRLIKGEMDKHDFNMSVMEEDIGAALLKRQGRLKIKAQRIAQHTPPQGRSVNDIQPSLEQLLLQNQVSRAIDSVESESIRQNLMTSMVLDKSTVETMTATCRESEILLIAKFAVLSGLTKSEYVSCVNRAKNTYPSQGNARSVTQKYLKVWKEALAYVESISY